MKFLIIKTKSNEELSNFNVKHLVKLIEATKERVQKTVAPKKMVNLSLDAMICILCDGMKANGKSRSIEGEKSPREKGQKP